MVFDSTWIISLWWMLANSFLSLLCDLLRCLFTIGSNKARSFTILRKLPLSLNSVYHCCHGRLNFVNLELLQHIILHVLRFDTSTFSSLSLFVSTLSRVASCIRFAYGSFQLWRLVICSVLFSCEDAIADMLCQSLHSVWLRLALELEFLSNTLQQKQKTLSVDKEYWKYSW